MIKKMRFVLTFKKMQPYRCCQITFMLVENLLIALASIRRKFRELFPNFLEWKFIFDKSKKKILKRKIALLLRLYLNLKMVLAYLLSCEYFFSVRFADLEKHDF
jgi:hypothetical protein